MQNILIKNGKILTPSKNFELRDIKIINGKIDSIQATNDSPKQNNLEIIDAKGGFVAPGFIDTHTHGAIGFDYSEITLDGLVKILAYLPKFGTTSILATLIPTNWETLRQTIKLINENKETIKNAGTKLIGLHLEGPYLNLKKMYSKPGDIFSPNHIEEFCSIIEESEGLIKLVTLAPELEHMKELITFLHAKGIIVSIGHSDMDGFAALEAFEHGISRVAHIYNGMTALDHRSLGIVGAAFTQNNIIMELILDGHHVCKEAAQIVYKIGPERTVLITDSNQILGLPEGEYIRPINRKVVYKDGQVRSPETNRLAGSVLSMDKAFKNSIEFLKIDPFDAAKLSSTNAARSLQLESIGSIEVGKSADIVIMDKNYTVKQTLIDGKVIFTK